MRFSMRNGKKTISARTHSLLALALVALFILNNVGRKSMDEGYEMIDVREPIIVGFPLRGEWLTPR